MFRTKIDLPSDQRAPLVQLLNERLADLIDLKLQAKQAHWNVKGPNFIALHKLFDDIAGEVEEYIDEVAERIPALGGVAEGTVAAVSQRSKLPTYSLKLVSGRDHIEAFSTALATVGRAFRASIDQAAQLGDADTSDLFTGISRGLDKSLWFLEAHVQDEK